MRKSCAKLVDELRMGRGNEHILYPGYIVSDTQVHQSSTGFPHYPQAEPTTLSTALLAKINLLPTHFPTISTGLITNTIT